MNKIIAIIILFFLLIAAAVYLIIPTKIHIAKSVVIDASDINISKFLVNRNAWKKWWPGNNPMPDQFVYMGTSFQLTRSTNSGMYLSVNENKLTYKGNVSYLSEGDVTKVTFYAEIPAGANPFARVLRYMEARQLSSRVGDVLIHLKKFLENEKNAYGYKIYLGKVKDPYLLVTAESSTEYPNAEKVYAIIDNLLRKMQGLGAKETNYPMLNVNKDGTNHYEITVAIPIDKPVKADGNYTLNQMLKGGNILEADVKGGPNTVKDAYVQVKYFMKDHRLVPPAMPFESLITNRMLVKDTTQWLTKLYYPIF